MIINDVVFTNDLECIISELKSQLDLNQISLLSHIKDSGDNIMVTCPYHKNGQERRPSAGIRKSDGKFHCFTCKQTHELYEVISHCFGYNDLGVFGWNWLLKNFLTVSVMSRKTINLDLSRCDTKSLDMQYVTEQELDKYRQYHEYMWERKLNPNIVELFDIGYDKSTNCLTFPIRDINGNTLIIARRSVCTKYFNYPSHTLKPLYGLYELYQLDIFPSEVIVCESMLDALVCWVWGKYAVALNGVGTNLQFKQLKQLPCRKLILATDNDSAGLKARQIIRDNVKNKIITEYILPSGFKDLNDLNKNQFDNLVEIF